MKDEDEPSLFAQEVAGIKPLEKGEVYLRKKGPAVDFHARKQAAVIATRSRQ